MTAVAIYSIDPVLRCSLEQLLREVPAMTVVGVADIQGAASSRASPIMTK